MKRSRPWLRWIALGLAVEGCLWLFGACRPCTDYTGNLDRTRPLLLARRDGGVMISPDGKTYRIFDESLPETKLLLDFISKKSAPHSKRTREGQLLDDHGRILLNRISEYSKFSYDSSRDELIWTLSSLDNLQIRSNGKTQKVKTWSIWRFIQIQPDGTIWVTEDNPMHTGGIAALDSSGNFLGWRAKGYEFALMADAAAEADDSVMPLVKRLLASKDKGRR